MTIPKNNPDAIDQIVERLSAGGVVVLPCDTIYGLVGAAAAASRLRAIKGRRHAVPFLYLVAEEAWLQRLRAQPLPSSLRPFWPGPLTVVLRAAGHPGATVGVRVPADPFLQELLRRVDVPLISTSANRSGQPPLRHFAAIAAEFGNAVDLMVDGGELDGPSSTVIDATSMPARLIRRGAIDLPAHLLKR